METKFIEATDATNSNWGKFMVGRFTQDEWKRRSAVDRWGNGRTVKHSEVKPLLSRIGWGPDHLLVLDLQTCEGAVFCPHGYAKADLDKHKIWVCPMFEPFLTWLYERDLTSLEKLPSMVNLGDVPVAMAGYRRTGGGDV